MWKRAPRLPPVPGNGESGPQDGAPVLQRTNRLPPVPGNGESDLPDGAPGSPVSCSKGQKMYTV
jgi:hypothetical protein